MQFINDVSKNCKTSCKRCILNDASNTPMQLPHVQTALQLAPDDKMFLD